jgi:hypothetical protein
LLSGCSTTHGGSVNQFTFFGRRSLISIALALDPAHLRAYFLEGADQWSEEKPLAVFEDPLVVDLAHVNTFRKV